jgi:hypothetical protein
MEIGSERQKKVSRSDKNPAYKDPAGRHSTVYDSYHPQAPKKKKKKKHPCHFEKLTVDKNFKNMQ